jgi:hypothetical protein
MVTHRSPKGIIGEDRGGCYHETQAEPYSIFASMLQKLRKYLSAGWHVAHDLHTAQWIIFILISLLPASLGVTLLNTLGEHSVFLLFIAFVFCFGVIAFLALGLLGRPVHVDTIPHAPSPGEENPAISPTEGQQVPLSPAESHQLLYRAITLEVLRQFYNDSTTAEADKIISQHIGKWFSVYGVVQNVTKYPLTGGMAVWFGEYPVSYIFDFEKEWADRVESLSRGQTITIGGILSEMNLHRVVLKNCEIIKWGFKATSVQ